MNPKHYNKFINWWLKGKIPDKEFIWQMEIYQETKDDRNIIECIEVYKHE